MFTIIIVILGLIVFEIVSGVDNAIVNAHVLKTMSEKWRKIFLFWGILTAVFLIRGLLPFVIVWLSAPEIGFSGVFRSVIENPPEITQLLEERKGIILVGAALAPFTYFISLVVCALIDFGIYHLVGDCVVCYHCHAILRGYAGADEVESFDLNTSDKYIDIERERGW